MFERNYLGYVVLRCERRRFLPGHRGHTSFEYDPNSCIYLHVPRVRSQNTPVISSRITRDTRLILRREAKIVSSHRGGTSCSLLFLRTRLFSGKISMSNKFEVVSTAVFLHVANGTIYKVTAIRCCFHKLHAKCFSILILSTKAKLNLKIAKGIGDSRTIYNFREKKIKNRKSIKKTP